MALIVPVGTLGEHSGGKPGYQALNTVWRLAIGGSMLVLLLCLHLDGQQGAVWL